MQNKCFFWCFYTKYIVGQPHREGKSREIWSLTFARKWSKWNIDVTQKLRVLFLKFRIKVIYIYSSGESEHIYKCDCILMKYTRFLIHGLFWLLFLHGYPYFIHFYSSGFIISLNSGYTCILEVNNTTPYPYGGWFSFPGLSSADLPWRLPVQCSECFHKTVRNLGQEDWCVFPLLLNFCQNVHHSPPICPFLFYPFYWLFP